MIGQNKTYVAIIGDLVSSRKTENRQKLQLQLLDSLSDINRKSKDSLFSALIVTTGDEFQTLAKYLKAAYKLAIELKHRSNPQDKDKEDKTYNSDMPITCQGFAIDVWERFFVILLIIIVRFEAIGWIYTAKSLSKSWLKQGLLPSVFSSAPCSASHSRCWWIF